MLKIDMENIEYFFDDIQFYREYSEKVLINGMVIA